MKLNLDAVLVDHARKPVTETVAEDAEPRVLTLRHLLEQTVLGLCSGDEEPNSAQKMQRYHLGLKLQEEEAEFSIDDLGLLQRCVENRKPQLLPWLFGQVMLLLEGKETGL